MKGDYFLFGIVYVVCTLVFFSVLFWLTASILTSIICIILAMVLGLDAYQRWGIYGIPITYIGLFILSWGVIRFMIMRGGYN